MKRTVSFVVAGIALAVVLYISSMNVSTKPEKKEGFDDTKQTVGAVVGIVLLLGFLGAMVYAMVDARRA